MGEVQDKTGLGAFQASGIFNDPPLIFELLRLTSVPIKDLLLFKDSRSMSGSYVAARPAQLHSCFHCDDISQFSIIVFAFIAHIGHDLIDD